VADKVLIDTNVAIYLAKGNEWGRRFTYAVEGKVLAMAFATAGELLLTSRRSSTPEKTLRHWHDRF
jgi:predicted nucleic acid-binding protein